MRGSRRDRRFSPSTGYRHDRLYRVTEHWAETGKSGYRIWRFRLLRLAPDEAAPYVPPANIPPGTTQPVRVQGVIQRIVRNTKVADTVKHLYDYTCQVCDEKLDVPVGAYAEGAHIRALGRPHNGPDQADNVLCLCPNHHLLFDKGAIYVDDAFNVRNHVGTLMSPLTRNPQHVIDLQHLRYHRESFGLSTS